MKRRGVLFGEVTAEAVSKNYPQKLITFLSAALPRANKGVSLLEYVTTPGLEEAQVMSETAI